MTTSFNVCLTQFVRKGDNFDSTFHHNFDCMYSSETISIGDVMKFILQIILKSNFRAVDNYLNAYRIIFHPGQLILP